MSLLTRSKPKPPEPLADDQLTATWEVHRRAKLAETEPQVERALDQLEIPFVGTAPNAEKLARQHRDAWLRRVEDLRQRIEHYNDPSPPRGWNVNTLDGAPSAPARRDNAYADALEREGWSERAIAALVDHANAPRDPLSPTPTVTLKVADVPESRRKEIAGEFWRDPSAEITFVPSRRTTSPEDL